MTWPFIYKVINVGEIAAGATVDVKWTADKDYVIDKIHIIDLDGHTLYKVNVTIRIDDDIFTRDAIPCCVLAPDEWTSPTIGAEFGRNRTIYFSFKNDDSVSHTIKIVLKLKPKGGTV